VVRFHTVDMYRKLLLGFLIGTGLGVFAYSAQARAPLSTELRSGGALITNTPVVLVATSTNLFITSLSISETIGAFRTSSFYCGTTQIWGTGTIAPDSSTPGRATYVQTDWQEPVRCTGTLWAIASYSNVTPIAWSAYVMTDAAFDEGGGGGGGGTTVDFDPLIMCFGALVVLFTIYVVVRIFERK